MYEPPVSIVVCTYNRAESLTDTLHGLSQLNYPNYEIIVVNGPSTDATTEAIAKWRNRIKTVQCDAANLAISRNLGITAAAGEIVAFIDDDAVPHPQWINRLATKYADDRVGGVGGFTIDNTGSRFQSRKTLCDRFGNAFSVSAMFDERPLNKVGTTLYPSLLGTNSSFRRSVLVEIGGFDSAFAYFLDETDVCLRIVDAGFQILYETSALVFHQFAASELRTPRRIKRTYYPLAVSKSYFIMRHGAAHSVEEAGRQLNSFRESILSENETLAEGGDIIPAHRTSLDQDLLRGIDAGTALARTASTRSKEVLVPPKASTAFNAFKTERRMRIALVSQNFTRDQSTGIGRWTWMLAKGLTERGHIVHVITRADQASTQFVEGYWLHSLPDDPFAGEVVAINKKIPLAIASRAAAVRQAVRYVKSFGLDLVSFPIWDLEGIACIDEPNVALTMSLHTSFGLAKAHKEEWQVRPLQEHFEIEPTIAAEHRLLQEIPTILANSKAIVSDLSRLSGIDFSARTIIVPHGTTDPFAINANRRTMRANNSSKVKLLYAGRFEARKGFDIAILAFAALLHDFEIEVDLVGDDLSPQAVSWLEALGVSHLLTHPQVRFTGVVDRETLDDMFSTADIVVLPSRYESFGLVAIEAMAAGAPVIAFRVGGLAEIVEDGVSGRLLKTGGNDIQAVVDAVRSLVQDSNLRSKLSAGARAAFERHYSLTLMIDGVEKALKLAQERRLVEQ